jgi:heme exporter protein C
MALPLWLMVIGTKLWFAGSLLAKARADNLLREAGKAWVTAGTRAPLEDTRP